ncbi:MAG: hypothetical protein AAB250_08440, partial [Bdellovibrionota bacterium]
RVGKETLKFFHFSSYKPSKPTYLSAHRPDLKLKDLGVVADLTHEYHELLAKCGNTSFDKLDYGFRTFTNGIAIPDVLRTWSKQVEHLDRFDNPFDARQHCSFFDWLLDSVGTDLCPLAKIIRDMRPDVQRKIPGHDAESNGLYMQWLLERGVTDLGLDPRFSKLLGKKMAAYEGLVM